jgi:hypothetical protein
MIDYSLDLAGVEVRTGDFVAAVIPRHRGMFISRVMKITPKGVSVLERQKKGCHDTTSRTTFLKCSDDQVQAFFKKYPEIAEFWENY